MRLILALIEVLTLVTIGADSAVPSSAGHRDLQSRPAVDARVSRRPFRRLQHQRDPWGICAVRGQQGHLV
jgi:hypothetical protein